MNNVLFVDDEVAMLNSIKRNMFNLNFQCHFANSGKKALDIMREEEIHVLVCDLHMPNMSGIELLHMTDQLYPNIVKIVLSANHQASNILASINKGKVFKYLIKPWNFKEEFLPTLNEAVDRYNFKNTYLNSITGNAIKFDSDFEEIDAFIATLEKKKKQFTIIKEICPKLPYMDKDTLVKISLDMYTRSEIMEEELEELKFNLNCLKTYLTGKK